MSRVLGAAAIGVLAASIAASLAGSALADDYVAQAAPVQCDVGEVARVECDAVRDMDTAFALSFDGSACWRLRVTCEGGASGSAVLDTGDDYDGEVDYSAVGDVGEECEIEGNSVGLDGISHYSAKCEFDSGATFQVRTQPVDVERCFVD